MENKQRQVINLGLVSLFNDLSSEVVMRVLPLYMITVVKATFIGVGVVEAISEATGTLGRLFAGKYSDRKQKRKPYIFFGYVLSVFSRPLLLLQATLTAASAARFLEKVGKSIRTPARDALIADLSSESNRGKNFGINRALDTLGAVIGLAAVFVVLHFWPTDSIRAIKGILVCACAVGVIALFVLAFLVKEPPQEQIVRPKEFKLSWATLDPRLKSYLWISLLFGLATSSDAFIIVRAKEMGFAIDMIFLILTGFNIVSALAAYFASKLSDTYGRKVILFIGWSIYALAYIIFGFGALNQLGFVLTLSFYGLFYALTDGTEKALVADFQSAERRGEAYGWLGLIQGIAVIPANIIFGGLYQNYGQKWAFWFSATCALCGLIGLFFFKIQNEREQCGRL